MLKWNICSSLVTFQVSQICTFVTFHIVICMSLHSFNEQSFIQHNLHLGSVFVYAPSSETSQPTLSEINCSCLQWTVDVHEAWPNHPAIFMVVHSIQVFSQIRKVQWQAAVASCCTNNYFDMLPLLWWKKMHCESCIV